MISVRSCFHFLTTVVWLLLLSPALGEHKPLRPVHTFSIVAFDPASGEMGVAVQWHWFAVGGGGTWGGAGGGAGGGQSFIDPRSGPAGLKLVARGGTGP